MLLTFKSHLGSKVKLRVTVILSFQNKVFSVNTSFLFNNAVHSLQRTVLSLAFTPSRFEAHGSSYSTFHVLDETAYPFKLSGPI